MTRLNSRFLVDLLIRRTEAAGGFATVLTRGDQSAGVILIQCCNRGEAGPLLERRSSIDGRVSWESVGPDSDEEARGQYRDRRRSADPDLWIIELDIADAPRFVAEWGALT